MAFKSVLCSSRKHPTEGNGIWRGGAPKGGNFRWGGGSLTDDFFSRGLSKIGDLLMNNSIS